MPQTGRSLYFFVKCIIIFLFFKNFIFFEFYLELVLWNLNFRRSCDRKTSKCAFGWPVDRGILWIFGFHRWLLWGSFGWVNIFHGNVKSTENQFLLRFFWVCGFSWIFFRAWIYFPWRNKNPRKKNYDKIPWIHRTNPKTISNPKTDSHINNICM